MGEINKAIIRTNEFGKNYGILCCQRGVSPLSTIQSRLTENRLRFCCDRVNLEDWGPILNALAADRSLVEIHAYSRDRAKKKIDESIDTEKKLEEFWKYKKNNARGSIIYTNYLLRCLVDAIAVCSRDSNILTFLTLDGIPLGSGNYLNILCNGLSVNRNIQSISLARCKIGDSGCQLVLRAVLENSSLQLINFASCLLTSKSANFITSFLRKKRSKILKNAWHESDETETSSHQSLHTLILNKNIKFGNEGLRVLTDTLKDDFWLKSLSLRRCGLTKKSGNAIIDLLETNSTLLTINFKDNGLPVEILKTTRKLLKRRLEKGERISLRRRLINRKKVFRSNRSIGGNKGSGKNRRNTPKRLSIIKNGTSKEALGDVNEKKTASNLSELRNRLSNLIIGNRNLKRGLSNQRRLLVNEKRSRIDAEKSYQSMRPVIERLRNGCAKQNRIRSRVLYETHLCTDIRKIFKNLENISALDAKVSADPQADPKDPKNPSENVIVEKLSIDYFQDLRNKNTFGAHKRPHCPPRQRV